MSQSEKLRSVIFRADASREIGTGHIMRCLTLAKALQAHDVICRFICREHPNNLIETIREQGFDVISLPMVEVCNFADEMLSEPLKYSSWLGSSWQLDAMETINSIGVLGVDMLIVDHYAIDACWESQLRQSCKRLMVIDDLADRSHDCDILLDQNLGRTSEEYSLLIPPGAISLIGPKYAILRPEFALMREYSLLRRSKNELKNLLIALGGIDMKNIGGQILELLQFCDLPRNLKVSIIMGSRSPWLKLVEEKAAKSIFKVEVLIGVDDVAKVMAESDLAIGAIGGMAWERCALGLPTLGIVLADNQQSAADALQEAGACFILRDVNLLRQKFPLEMKKIKDQKVLNELKKRSIEICDGRGAARVLASIFDYEKSLEPIKVLVTSASKKIPLIRAVKEAAIKLDKSALVVAGDFSDAVLSAYIADEFWKMPECKDENVAIIAREAKRRGVNFIIPTRDGELKFWAHYAEIFKNQGISVIVSSVDAIDRCIDKLKFSDFGKDKKLPIIESSLLLSNLDAQFFVVKERFGAGSKNIGISLTRTQAKEHAKLLRDPIFQPFVSGKEFSVDAWVDEIGKVKGVILRTRDLVIDGESQVTTTFSDPMLEKVLQNIIEELNLRGPIVLQAIRADDGGIHIIECNPRFGGASTAGIAAGLDSIYWSLVEVRNGSSEKNHFVRSNEEITQIRVPADIFL